MEIVETKIQTTIHYEQLQNSSKRITVFQGGTRSGKTYNVLLWLLFRLLGETNKVLTICRASMPSLKGSVMRDCLEILKEYNLYDEKLHNKTESSYRLNNNLIEFISLDESMKVRGRKRDYLFMNEANEMDYESFQQLAFRTTSKIILDFNPHQEFSYIYDNVIPRDDAEFYISTYKDNPFLEQSIIDEIERLQFEDENFWRIYGLGERGISSERIYSNWDIVNEFPDNFNETVYGLDFGFNHPTALVEINEIENDIYLRELIYKRGLLNTDIIKLMNDLIPNKDKFIYADSANPDKIEEIFKAGFNIHPADKSVKDGIDHVKRKRLHIHKDSVNLIKEIKSYSWKVDKSGRVLDEPVKFSDDLMDSTRYGIFNVPVEYRVRWL